MQLTIRDVSKFLNVPEATVTRWIKRRGLPAQYVGGHYRFNRVDLLEWARANAVKVSVEVFAPLEASDTSCPSLEEALEVGGIFHGLSAASKDDALKSLVQVLPVPDDVDRELLLQLFLARETSATTAIGDGIALPHVRKPVVLNVTRPMLTLGFLEKPVDFEAADRKPVYVLFSLICPTIQSHLQMLSRLSYALHDGHFKAIVISRGRPEQIMDEARRVEASLAVPVTKTGK